jgi:hypothetical protein
MEGSDMTRHSRLLCIAGALVTVASVPTGAVAAEPDDVRRARAQSFKKLTVARVVESGPSTPGGVTRIQPTPPTRPPSPLHYQVLPQPPAAAPSPNQIVRAPKAPKRDATLPQAAFRFDSISGKNDPQIAVGHDYIIVTAYDRIAFHRKNDGAWLKGQIIDQAGNLVPMNNPQTTWEFFRPLRLASNPAHLNSNLNLPSGKSCDAALLLDSEEKNPLNQPPGAQHCLNDIYDTRVTWDRYRNRFWIIALARSGVPALVQAKLKALPYAHTIPQDATCASLFGKAPSQDVDTICAEERSYRHRVAVAVSKTANPLDGFYYTWWDSVFDHGACDGSTVYVCPDSVFEPGQGGDYPMFIVTEKYAVQTNSVSKFASPDPFKTDTATYAIVNVVPAEPLTKGEPSTGWSFGHIEFVEKGAGGTQESVRFPLCCNLTPARHEGFHPTELILLVMTYSESKLLVMGFYPDEGSPPPLYAGFVNVTPLGELVAASDQHFVLAPQTIPTDGPTPPGDPEGPKLIFHNLPFNVMNAVHYRGDRYELHAAMQDCVKWTAPQPECTTAIRVVRVDVSFFVDWIQVLEYHNLATAQSNPNLDRSFERNGPGDGPSDLVYYGNPGIEVTQLGDMVLVYSRSGATVFPEARYSIYKHDEPEPRASRVLHKGLKSAGGNIDTAGIAVDPSDGLTVWMAHVYVNSSGHFRIAVGKVKP